MIKIYYASSFFDKGGYNKSKEVVESIREYFEDKVEVYLPQENGDINDKKDISKLVTAIDIAKGDNEHLKQADILIADLDGVEIDSGVSAEIGYVAGRNEILKYHNNVRLTLSEEGFYLMGIEPIKIIGFNTDIRLNKATPEIVELIKKSSTDKAIEIIENLKVNNLYRNLYTIGLVEEWGEYIVSQDNYIGQIIDSIEEVLCDR